MSPPDIGEVYDDHRSPGRQVKVIALSTGRVQVETVTPADAAISVNSVGRQTWIDAFNFRSNFTRVPATDGG